MRGGAQFDGLGRIGTARKLEPVAKGGGVVDEPGNGRSNNECACEPEGARLQPSATEQLNPNRRPGQQRDYPAVVAGEDGRDQRRGNPAEQPVGSARVFVQQRRHSTSQTTIQIISQTKSGSVIAVVCR